MAAKTPSSCRLPPSTKTLAMHPEPSGPLTCTARACLSFSTTAAASTGMPATGEIQTRSRPVRPASSRAQIVVLPATTCVGRSTRTAKRPSASARPPTWCASPRSSSIAAPDAGRPSGYVARPCTTTCVLASSAGSSVGSVATGSVATDLGGGGDVLISVGPAPGSSSGAVPPPVSTAGSGGNGSTACSARTSSTSPTTRPTAKTTCMGLMSPPPMTGSHIGRPLGAQPPNESADAKFEAGAPCRQVIHGLPFQG